MSSNFYKLCYGGVSNSLKVMILNIPEKCLIPLRNKITILDFDFYAWNVEYFHQRGQ